MTGTGVMPDMPRDATDCGKPPEDRKGQGRVPLQVSEKVWPY